MVRRVAWLVIAGVVVLILVAQAGRSDSDSPPAAPPSGFVPAQEQAAAVCQDEPVLVREGKVVWDSTICEIEADRNAEYEMDATIRAELSERDGDQYEGADQDRDPDYRSGP